jgi:glycosyltransferase EpsD
VKRALITATVDSHIKAFHLPTIAMLNKNGYKVDVVTGDKGDIEGVSRKYQIDLKKSPYKLSNIKAYYQLKRIINSNNYDIVHTHTPTASVVTRLAANRARKSKNTKVLYTAHGFHFYKGGSLAGWLIFFPIEYLLARSTTVLITINTEDYNRAKKYFKTRVEYLPGVGVDPARFKTISEAKKASIRKDLGLSSDDYVMIFAAELNKNKNQVFLIDCMRELVKGNPKYKLLLPGLDNYNGKNQKLVSKYKLKDNVLFLGYRTDISDLLQISNLALSSSKREGLPVNILEALQSNLPVLALNARGMSDILSSQPYGLEILNNPDIKEFSNKIMRISNTHTPNTVFIAHCFNYKSILSQLSVIYDLKESRIR